jgi:hypothetical protein
MKKMLLLILVLLTCTFSSLLVSQTNYAIRLDGTENAYVRTAFTANKDIFANWTVECWVIGTSAPVSGSLRYNGPICGDKVFAIMWDHEEPSYAGAASTYSNLVSYSSTFGTLSGGQWYHLAATFAGGTLTTYKNGEVVTTTTGIPALTESDFHGLYIGSNSDAVTEHRNGMDGQVDEVRIWNTTRTQEQIRSSAFTYLSGSETGLNDYWKFNEGSGTSAADSKGSFAGILYGGASFITSTAPFSNSVMSSQTMSSQTEVRGIWYSSPENISTSGGLKISKTFTGTENAVFGHNNESDITTEYLPAENVIRLSKIWYIVHTGDMSSTSMRFDLSDLGINLTPPNYDNYTLLYRSSTSGTFTEIAIASSLESTDQIIFTGITLNDGYYTLGTKNNGTSPLQSSTLVFYSRIGTYDLSDVNNWNTARDFSDASLTTLNPGYLGNTGNTLVVQNGSQWVIGNNVALNTEVIFKIESGGIVQADNALTVAANGKLIIEDGGTYIHNNYFSPSTTIFKGRENFFELSNFKIYKWDQFNMPFPTGISFGNLEINLNASLSNPWQLAGTLTTVRGNLTIANTGGQVMQLNTDQEYTLTVGGVLNMTDGSVAATFNEKGTWKLGGLNQTGGSILAATNALTIHFTNPTSALAFTSGLTSNVDWVIDTSASLTLSRNLSITGARSLTVYGSCLCGSYLIDGAGTFTLAEGGTVGVGSINGLDASTGNIRSSAINLSKNAHYMYTYTGNLESSSGSLLPDTVDQLTINVTDDIHTLSLVNPVVIRKTLTLTHGYLFYYPGGMTLLDQSTIKCSDGRLTNPPVYGNSSSNRVHINYSLAGTRYTGNEIKGTVGAVDSITMQSGKWYLDNSIAISSLKVNDGATFRIPNGYGLTINSFVDLGTSGALDGNGGNLTLNGSGADIHALRFASGASLGTLTIARGSGDFTRLASNLTIGTLNLNGGYFTITDNTLTINNMSYGGGHLTGGTSSNLVVSAGGSTCNLSGVEGDYLELQNLTVNKNISLGIDLWVHNTLQFNNGILQTNAYDVRMKEETSHIDGVSDSKYIAGGVALMWSGIGTKTYPIGSSTAYRPVTLEVMTDGFHMMSAPICIHQYDSTHAMTQHDAAIGSISTKRFWKITKDMMIASLQTNITFPWGTDDGISSVADVRVARENTSTANYWQQDNYVPATGTTSAGSITYSGTLENTDWALATAAPAPPIVNTSKTDFTTGTNPYAVAIGEINGDGKPDMAVVNYSSNTVSVFLNGSTFGGSTPYFTAKTDFPTGTNPRSVAIGDLNNDGKLDLAVANFGSSNVSVFINTTALGSDVPLFSKFDFTTGSMPSAVAIGDFNKDGLLDLAVTSYSGDVVDIFLNTTTIAAPTPTFASRVSYSTGSGSHPYAVAVADMNLDGIPDIVTANDNANTASVLLNTTTPGNTGTSFQTHVDVSTGSHPRSVALGDFNNDGKPDMAVAIEGSAVVSVFINTTESGAAIPTFSNNTDYTTGTGPTSVALRDMNGDGLIDMLVANGGTTTVSTFTNRTPSGNLTPSFTASSEDTTGSSPYSIAICDFNGDGKPDMATANYNSANVSVLLSNTTMGSPVSFLEKQDIAFGYNVYSIVAGDINADGKPDIATITSNNCVSVNLNTTTFGSPVSSFSSNKDFATGTDPIGIALGDINSDGKPDLAAVLTSGTVSVFLNTTSAAGTNPMFTTITDIPTGSYPISVALADVNCDGKPDIVTANWGGDSISVLLNTSIPGSFSVAARKDFATGSKPNSIAICDLDGDGRPDIATTSNSSNTISVFMNTTTPGSSTANFTLKTDFATANSPCYVAGGDLNGDGLPDLAVVNTLDDNVSVFLSTTCPGSATPIFRPRRDFPAGNNPCAVSISDVNGDGKLDLVVVNHHSTSVSVLLNTTPPGDLIASFALPTDYTSGNQPWAIAIHDFNCDGKTDLAVANRTGNSVSILLNGFTPLPVEMTSFTATVQGMTAKLQWRTETEVNNYGFEVERRSVNSDQLSVISWQKIGFVSGAGTSNTPKEYSFTDAKFTAGRYAYRLKQVDNDGTFKYSQSVEVEVGMVPRVFTLSQNYPNPFNPSTTIEFTLADDGMTTLKIFDILGREVVTLVNEELKAGIQHSVLFDASRFASGLYFYRIETGKNSLVRKLMFLK